jgi:hypothetical protein
MELIFFSTLTLLRFCLLLFSRLILILFSIPRDKIFSTGIPIFYQIRSLILSDVVFNIISSVTHLTVLYLTDVRATDGSDNNIQILVKDFDIIHNATYKEQENSRQGMFQVLQYW